MWKLDMKRITDRAVKLIELCLPSVFREARGGELLRHGVRLHNVVSDMCVIVKENK
jgi:hypothetical protein